MYEDLIGKNIRVIKGDGYPKYGKLISIKEGKLKLLTPENRTVYITIGTEQSVEEVDEE